MPYPSSYNPVTNRFVLGPVASFPKQAHWMALRFNLLLLSLLLLPLQPLSRASEPDLPESSVETEWEPRRPIRILVYMSPGGLIDFTARRFADIARRYSPQPIVIINRPGAGGIVAFEEFIQTPTNGHLILAVTRSNVAKLIEARREDLFQELDWFALVANDPECVIVNRNSEAHDWASLVEQNKRMRGRQLWPGPDIGGLDHLVALKLWDRAGLSARWIPYSSGGRAMAALLGGFGSAYVGNPYDIRGRPDLVIAAISAADRLPQFPEVPTFRELGIEGLDAESMWRGFAVRPDLGKAERRWWDALFRKVSSDPDWIAEWSRDAIDSTYVPSERFRRMVDADRGEFGTRLRDIGLLREDDEPGLFARISNPPMPRLLLGALVLANLGLAAWLSKRSEKTPASRVMAVSVLGSVVLLFTLLIPGIPPSNVVDLVGPRGMPILWISLLVPLLCLQLFLDIRAGPQGTPNCEGIRRNQIALAAVLIGYAAALPAVGYLMGSLLFVPVALMLLGERRIWHVASVTVVWCLLVPLVFRGLLNVTLPEGIIEDWIGLLMERWRA